MSETDVWEKVKYDLSLQMTEATFDTWLRNSRLISEEINRLTVAVANHYAVDWLTTRLNDTVLRTAARTLGRPVEVQFIVSDDGQHPDQDETDTDVPTDCRVAIEIINFDPTTAGFVMTSNYAWQYWQPYLAAVERANGALTTGVSFCLWNTLRSFPAAWVMTGRPQWPSIFTLADMVARGNRHKIMGRSEYGQKRKHSRMIGALEILENERIVWPHTIGTGRETVYCFRVLNSLPILTPLQIGRLSERLQERHAREIERCKLDINDWEQLTLPTLLEDH